ncbi:MAG: hypothetical protein ISS01_03235 [Nanoarchaeota archaeon]|nr:hypothetical protein [Nanoarchaeota archaeon]
MIKTKENLLKALLNTIGQNKVCDSLAGINKAFDILEKKQRDEIIKDIINYQHGFIRDDGFGNPERAQEWQVIEDLINSLNK